MDPDEIEKSLSEYFRAHPEGIAAAYLFGSVARRQMRKGSDVDVGVLFDEDPPNTLEGLHLDLERELEKLLGEEVQLVVLNHAPADLVHRVLRDGKLLINRSPSKRIAFEVAARNEYFDLEPVQRSYRRRERVRS